MLMAEQFERCEKCGDGWFEKKTQVLVVKDGPLQWGKPVVYQQRVSLKCTSCGHVQYQYDE